MRFSLQRSAYFGYSTIAVLLIAVLIFTLVPARKASATVETFSTAVSTTWTAPAGVVSVQVECWGAGGGGGRGDGTGVSGGGGGGGGYSIVTSLSVTPGNSYTYTVGTLGSGASGGATDGTAGTDSTFNSTSCVAKGGGGGLGATNGGTAGAGGLATGGAGDLKYDGGTGGSGAGATTGGGGGGSAGTGSAGNAGTAGSSGGAGATAVTGGGSGGAGGASTANGSPGGAPGGAGGGGGQKSGGSELGGDGTDGQIRLTYTADSTPPNPDPMYFATAPDALSTVSVDMTATTATDATGPIQYYFEAVTGSCGANIGTGGADSGWQAGTTYTDTGLQVNKCYGYQVLARDGASIETATSTASSTYTLANTPGNMTYSGVTGSGLTIINAENSNPAANPTTNFAVFASSSDSRWDQVYVTAAAGTSSSQTWLTDAQIDNLALTGLLLETTYEFEVVARNQDNILTATSTRTGTTTLSDTTAPTPNPPYFTVAPNNDAALQLAMTSVTVTDDIDTSPSYYFASVTGTCGADIGTGGTDSGWQIGASYIDTGLQVNKCYSYEIVAKDDFENITATSSASSSYTSANVPGALAFSAVTGTTLDLTNDENGNPTTNPATTFAVYATSSDATWNQRYVDSGGNPTATKTWLTDAQIDAVTVSGLSYSTEYQFVVIARNVDGDETASSTLAATSTLADTAAPTPNPPTFQTAPTNDSPTSISATSTTLTDPTTPISYYFGSVAGSCGADLGTGGTDSGWQSADTTYTDTGLQPNKCYAYTLTGRDAANNYTATSSAASTYTSANTPGVPSYSTRTGTTLTLLNDENSNPAANPVTSFAVFIQSTSPLDASHDAQYVDASGNPSASAVWLTDAQIDGLEMTGLVFDTTYTMQVKARNADGDETPFGSTAALATSAFIPDTLRVQGVRLQGTRLR